MVALLAEGVGRNLSAFQLRPSSRMSPSSRRAWVEIGNRKSWPRFENTSPSSRRAWVEILPCDYIIPWSLRRPPRGGRG